MIKVVYAVMVFDKSGEVLQFGGKDNLYNTFAESSKKAEELREINPSCRAYSMTLLRKDN